jgi:DNA polymerase I-like protein with 3'-5' exonuclease and polymerase domains
VKIYYTDKLPSLDQDFLREAIYNGMDSLLTVEIFDTTRKYLKNDTGGTYEFSKSLLGPVLSAMRRGMKVDDELRQKCVQGDPAADNPLLQLGLDGRILRLGGMVKQVKKGKGKWVVVDENAVLQKFAKAVWGKPLNYHSDKQLKEFFYDALAIPPIVVVKKGERKISCDREALEKMAKNYVRAVPLCSAIIRLRDLEKQRDVFVRGLDPRGRWLASFNIGGTETGRWSSADHPLGYGANFQNIDPLLRHAFIADEDHVLVNCDLQGAEARAVAYLAGDEEYIRAVESADCHSLVASMVWGIPNNPEAAKQKFYRDFTYRDLAKRGQHGSNYGGTAKTLARILKVEVAVMEDFQGKYFGRFPRIREWHQYVATELQRSGVLVTPLGRRRQFWGRLSDDATLREAIAYQPQELIGTINATAFREIWRQFEPRVQVLVNGHDAVLMQMPTKDLDNLLPQVLKCMEVPMDITCPRGITRRMLIPYEAEVGFNWGDMTNDNLCGLRKYKPGHTMTELTL